MQNQAKLPAFKGIYHNINYDFGNVVNLKVENSYNSSSEKALTREELKKYITQNGLLKDVNLCVS